MMPVKANRAIPVPDALARFSQSWKSVALSLAIGMAMLIVLPRRIDDFALVQATVYAVMAIHAVSLGFVWDFGGILCFGQSAFFGLGAYVYAIAVTNLGDSMVPFLLAIVLPATFAAVLGYLIFYGRLSDVYMGVITLTVTLILFNVVNSTAVPEWKIGNAPGGFNGIPNIAPLNTPGNIDDVISPRGLFELSLGALLGVYLLLRVLLAFKVGCVIVASKENANSACCSVTTRASTSSLPSCSARPSRVWPDACSPTGARLRVRPSSVSRSRRRSSSG
ncbi:Urea ABC transporter, permease protein UrtC [Candidatus Paraburkholderia calva]|nr:Urea ABC transporter, permease protein UrtC [Candidatus Paraburkholderia calva]